MTPAAEHLLTTQSIVSRRYFPLVPAGTPRHDSGKPPVLVEQSRACPEPVERRRELVETRCMGDVPQCGAPGDDAEYRHQVKEPSAAGLN